MGNPFVFEPVLAFALIGSFIVIGVFLRAKIGLFQTFLLPSCLIGGVLGCIFLNFKLVDLSFTHFETIAYHCLNIAFISVGLTRKNVRDSGKGKGKQVFRGALWMSLMKGVTWPLQAIVGLLFVILFTGIGQDMFSTFGLFLPLGFNEGPGQALSIAKVYEGFGFQDATTVGLTFALIGYIFCFFVGMPLLRAGLKKGSAEYGQKSLADGFLKGIIPANGDGDGDARDVPRKTLYPENIDNMAYQFAMVGLVYVLTFSFCYGISLILPMGTKKIVWGLFFVIGMTLAAIVTQIMKKIGVAYLVDPGTQHRITGFALDFMIAATLMAIQLAVVWKFIVPILAISLTGGLLTLLSIVYFGKRQENLMLERTIVVYGTYTGQLSTGLLLLRVVDPEFRSSLLVELGVFAVMVAPITLPCLVFATGQVSWGWGIWQTIGIYGAILVISLILIKILKFWGHPRELF
jgi:ESS family glutamate:Na+ symporter